MFELVFQLFVCSLLFEAMDVLLAVLVTAIVAADIADTALLGAVVTVLLAPSRELTLLGTTSPTKTSAVLVESVEPIFCLLGLPDSPPNSEQASCNS